MGFFQYERIFIVYFVRGQSASGEGEAEDTRDS